MKERPSWGTGLCYHIVGIRAEESLGRRRFPQIAWNPRFKAFDFKPIYYWMEWHVWDFHEKYNLPYLSLYDEGWSRVGCMICPLSSFKNRMRDKERWPGPFKAFEHAVAAWWERRSAAGPRVDKTGVPYKENTVEEYIQAWYRGFGKE